MRIFMKWFLLNNYVCQSFRAMHSSLRQTTWNALIFVPAPPPALQQEFISTSAEVSELQRKTCNFSSCASSTCMCSQWLFNTFCQQEFHEDEAVELLLDVLRRKLIVDTGYSLSLITYTVPTHAQHYSQSNTLCWRVLMPGEHGVIFLFLSIVINHTTKEARAAEQN